MCDIVLDLLPFCTSCCATNNFIVGMDALSAEGSGSDVDAEASEVGRRFAASMSA